LLETDNIADVAVSYPGYTLRKGMTGEHIRIMQNYLNRISLSYPAIHKIKYASGYFGEETEAAVKAYQKTREFGFTSVSGVVDKITWYKISYEYAAVTKLDELISTANQMRISRKPPGSTVSEGSKGSDVRQLQFMLNYISSFYAEVPPVIENGIFARETGNAVRAFQKAFGLPPNGIVDPKMWQEIYDVYWKINDHIRLPAVSGNARQKRYTIMGGAPKPGQAAVRMGDIVKLLILKSAAEKKK
jgi:peptidoglycan hydrolase-like protein with peptidoglycan-binding domain